VSARDLLADLAARGITLTIDGEYLRWHGALTVADRNRPLAAKPEVLAFLAAAERPFEASEVESPKEACERPSTLNLDGPDLLQRETCGPEPIELAISASAGAHSLSPHGGPECRRRKPRWLDTIRGRSTGAYCQGCGRWLQRAPGDSQASRREVGSALVNGQPEE